MNQLIEYTPENIISLAPNEVFVYGQNREARNGAGAALVAKQKFGGENGKFGLVKQSYGIITKELRYNYPPVLLEEVADNIIKFILFTETRPDLKFFVTKIGTNLAGFTEKEIGDIFRVLNPKLTPNIILPKEFAY